jgi:Carboxypeptidase regulatory-like domain
MTAHKIFSRVPNKVLLLVLFAAPTVCAVWSPPALAQATNATGTVQGTVTDPSGAAVPNAKITLTQPSTGLTKEITATGAGYYSTGSLLPGDYSLHVDAPGFSPTDVKLSVTVGTVVNGDVKLSLGSSTTMVEVQANAVQVDTAQTTVQGILDRQQIETLPLNGRNFLDLGQLQPGVQIQDGTSFDPTKNGFSSISFGGRFGRTARITVDGIDISDENVGTTTQNISSETIQEFQIAQSNLDISTSITSSGSVNVVSRSGTNSFHGSGFYNFRDQRAGNAEPTGYTPIPGVDADYMQRNNPGGSLGGPILKDKLFFFGGGEHFSQNVFNPVIFGGPLASANGGYPVKFRESELLGRLDYNAPHGIHAFARFIYDNNSDVAAFGGSNYSPFLNRDNTPGYGGGVDFAGGRFTHSFRAGYFKFVNHITDATVGSGIYNPTPGINLNIPQYNFSTGANLLAPQATVQSNKQVKYDGSWVKGNHTIRYGAGVYRLLGGGYASFFGISPQVSVNITPQVLAQAAAGPFPGGDANPENYPAGGGGDNIITLGNGQGFFTAKPAFGFPAGGQFDTRVQLYVGDLWKMTPRLTVNYGLRYIRDTGRSDANLQPPAILNQLLPGLGNKTNQPNLNFGPQAGFSFDPYGKGKTVIRAGAGIYYENNVWNNALFDAPPKLAQGLFFGTATVCPNASIAIPGSTKTITTVDGTPTGTQISAICDQPVGEVYQQFATLQSTYQAAVKQAGPQANGSYVGTTLAVPLSSGDFLFSQNYKTPSSYQMNFGVQQEVRPGLVLTADLLRNVGIHTLVGHDVNHVGDARFLNVQNAQAAIAATLAACGVGSIDVAIITCPGLHPGGATIADFAANGLDSGAAVASGYPNTTAAFNGENPTFGQVEVLWPAGRSVYDALQLSLQGQVHHAVEGINNLNLQVSYTYSHYQATGTTELGDSDFGAYAWDNNYPTKYFGPTSLDRHQQFSIGAVFATFGGVQLNTIAHLYSSLATNLNLPLVGSGDIFIDDFTGGGLQTNPGNPQGPILPGAKIGAFNRKYDGKTINYIIGEYNENYAGQLTPAGKALVNAGLFSSAQLSALGAVGETIAPAPPNQQDNDILRTFDFSINRPIRVLKEGVTITPSFGAFNILNAANYNNRTGVNGANVIGGNLNGTPGSPNGTAGRINEQNYRVSAGSGVYAEGSPRQLEYGLRVNF